ncbi:phosphatidate cytidylyltransferase, putative [Plasmodium knowlesi strain H]|uniref:dolichol kinase n=1 Tax=Plasmodium knowlesi (strain H) TaxID=5851 RepID=A0A1A7VUN8_PLAKH|nr:phosphatidate cytidylyltransferase, putative [Plasmodium knowlesi strain H]SBO28289.1 phosphatidate cytidylyltransferase, putative [Plasmodium knowlesi strain H]
MIRGILISLILITVVRREILYTNYCTYLWVFLTLLYSVVVVLLMAHWKKESKAKCKIKKGGFFSPGMEDETSPHRGGNLLSSHTLTIGAYHHREKMPPGLLKKKVDPIFLRLYEKGVISTWKLFLQIYGDNFFPLFFFPFLSTLLVFKFDILNFGAAKLSLVLVNEFLLGSVFLRYVRVNACSYLLFHALLFMATLGAMRIQESFATCFLCFSLNFVFYHMIAIGAFRLTDGVFSFLEGATVSVAGTLLLDAYAYGLFHAHLDGGVVPSVLSVFLSGVALSLTVYAACCVYLLQQAKSQKGKLIIASVMFLLYNILNLGARRYDFVSESETSAMQNLVDLLYHQQNYLLFFGWLIITLLYIFYIAKMVKRNGNLSYLRKHYHFLLFVNAQLSFLLGKVELLVVILSFAFLLLLFLEVARKIGQALSPDRNMLHKFMTSFIDDRDRRGLVVTHIYLLAGVYIPIVADVLLNSRNYLRKGTRSVFIFRDADLILHSSGLNAICIGDSFAAIGGLLFPIPKIKNTNNKSYAGFLFFFCSTFLSLLLESYFVQVGKERELQGESATHSGRSFLQVHTPAGKYTRCVRWEHVPCAEERIFVMERLSNPLPFTASSIRRFTTPQKTPLASLTAISMVSLFGALFEAYLHDIDNLILPIFTFCVYLCFEK